MKKYIKVLLITACVLFVLGAGIMISTYFIFYSDDIPSQIENDRIVTVEGEVIGIDISSSYYNVSIEKGDEFKVIFEDCYDPGTNVTIKDGILSIKGGFCDDIEILGFDVSVASKVFDTFGGKVTVIVPENEYMQLIYAEIGCGSFEMNDISCGRLVTQVGIGEISLKNVDVAINKFLECKLGTVYDNGDMKFAINHSVSSSDM